jgi:hypothetical protein
MKHRSTAVASEALELALRGKSFQMQDIKRGLSDPPSRQTIYRVLKQLSEDDWIEYEGKLWFPGTKAKLLGDVDDVEKQSRGFDLSADDLL